MTRDGDAGIDIALLRPKRFDIRPVHARLASFGLASLLLTACRGPLSILDPATEATERVAALWWVMLIGSIMVLGVVMALFLLPFLRSNERVPGNGKGRAAMERSYLARTYLFGGGLVFPIATLSALLVYALAFGEWLLPRPSEEVMRVEARGQMWRWEFTHPDGAGGTIKMINELHLPAEQPVEVTVVASDVIHSFWIPRLAGKIDAVPGHVNVLRIGPAPAGVYAGVCAEFCGLGHADMRFDTFVHPAADYARALAKAAGAEP